ncbi:MAG: aminotransferase class V-fold PLP-dependent enzyme [Actinobacteria bacterium]|nr:MAG: aminotransferase class V-fold PLP-dependent enzyme [Actinomycetota bacterium]
MATRGAWIARRSRAEEYEAANRIARVDAETFRAEFPVLERLAFLNAGTDGPVPRRGHDAAVRQLERELTDGRAGMPHFMRLFEFATKLRERLADALGCPPDDVALTRSTSDGVATVLSAFPLGPGDEVLTSDEEHPGVLAPLEGARRRRGFDVRVVPFAELANGVGGRTRLVACSHVSWVSGRVVDAAALAWRGPGGRHGPRVRFLRRLGPEVAMRPGRERQPLRAARAR